MGQLRRVLLTALPKLLVSRATGLLARIPLPRRLRPCVYRAYARRYGADLSEMAGALDDVPPLAAFFQRPLVDGARPLDAAAPFVWPADGRAVAAGPFEGGRLPQIKGVDYAVRDLVADDELARDLQRGSQATVYLAPGDYHRVHAPFAANVEAVVPLRGTLFPVNPPAVRCIRDLFVRNSRHVFRCRLPDGTAAAVVMVGAYNVGGTSVTVASGPVHAGDEIGRFGFGSTVVALVGPGGGRFAGLAGDQVVRMGAAAEALAAAAH